MPPKPPGSVFGDDVEHGDARVDVQELLGRPLRVGPMPKPASLLVDDDGPEDEEHGRPEGQRQDGDVGQDGGGLRALEQGARRRGRWRRARRRRGQQHHLLSHDVVDRSRRRT